MDSIIKSVYAGPSDNVIMDVINFECAGGYSEASVCVVFPICRRLRLLFRPPFHIGRPHPCNILLLGELILFLRPRRDKCAGPRVFWGMDTARELSVAE